MGERVTVIARFKAKEGADLELKELLLSLIEPSRSDEGCVNYDLHQAFKDPSLFVFHETWENKELLSKHSTTTHVQQMRSKSKALLAEPPEVILLTKISS